jgi:hypothetical protein
MWFLLFSVNLPKFELRTLRSVLKSAGVGGPIDSRRSRAADTSVWAPHSTPTWSRSNTFSRVTGSRSVNLANKVQIPQDLPTWRCLPGSLSLYAEQHCNENPIYVFLFWKLRCLSPNFHIHVSVCEQFIYFQVRSTYFLQQKRQIDRGNTYINRSQTQECGYWDCGCAIHFLQRFVSNFQHWFFAVNAKCFMFYWLWA